MPGRLGLAEGLIHLGMFISAGITLGLAALALLERMTGDDRRIVRWWYVAASAGLFFALLGAERVYHSLQG